MENKIQITILIFLLAIGFYFRINQVNRPLWIDEVKGLEIVSNYSEILTHYHGREIVTTSINKLIGTDTLFKIRFPYIISSLLTLIFIYIISKNKWQGLLICSIIAISPLFVHWSTMARPYTVALLFCALGYRWKWFYILAILTSPFSLAGFNWLEIKKRWLFYSILIILTVIWWKFYPAGGDHFNLRYLFNAKRLWIIPIGILGLHLIDPKLQRLFGISK